MRGAKRRAIKRQGRSKHQAPRSREAPNSKIQGTSLSPSEGWGWILEFGASLDSSCTGPPYSMKKQLGSDWILEYGSSLDLGAWILDLISWILLSDRFGRFSSQQQGAKQTGQHSDQTG